MRRKGFTLIELLAVIVILSVITLITVPMVTNVIEESKKKALVSSVQGILDSADYFTMSHETGVYEFLFDEEHQGSTKKGESLDYRGSIDGEGKLYLDEEGNTSICISNDKYYAYKNYNSGIIVGERKAGNCIIGFDALTNKYVAMLDDGTGQVSNVYSKNEVDNLVNSLNMEITNVKSNIEELQTNLNNLSGVVNSNQKSISDLNSQMQKNNFGDGIKLNSYTQDSPYEIPADGYVSIQFSGIAKRMAASVNIIGNTYGSNSFGKVTDENYYASYQNEVVSVKKGMKVYILYISDASEISIYFKPLS